MVERRGERVFAPLPPGVVKVRLTGSASADLARQITALPGVTVVTGPDAYPGDRLYLLVRLSEPEAPGEA